MINPRFLKIADRWRNGEVPEGKIFKVLQRDETGKPTLDLIPIENTVVHTSTQEEYDDLMRVYEVGGWKWMTGESLTQANFWEEFEKESTCIGAGVDFLHGGLYNDGKCKIGDKDFYLERAWDIISPQEFYDIQDINPEIISQINTWYEQND